MPADLEEFGHPMTAMPDAARSLYTTAWGELAAAQASAKHGWHLPVLGTASARSAGPKAELRTVVLRWVNQDHRSIGCHTDRRSLKVNDIQESGEATWLFYDADRKLQLRVSGPTVAEHDTPRADERWAESNLSSRRCYLAPHAPSAPAGEALSEPPPNLPEAVQGRVPTEEESNPGRANFAIIATTLTRLEILSLAHDGHERLAVHWPGVAPDAEPRWAWLMP